MAQGDNYKPGEKVDLATLAKQDANDESLRKYKESLLGNMAEVGHKQSKCTNKTVCTETFCRPTPQRTIPAEL